MKKRIIIEVWSDSEKDVIDVTVQGHSGRIDYHDKNVDEFTLSDLLDREVFCNDQLTLTFPWE